MRFDGLKTKITRPGAGVARAKKLGARSAAQPVDTQSRTEGATPAAHERRSTMGERKSVVLQIRMEPSLLEDLREWSARSKIPQAEICRWGIELALDRLREREELIDAGAAFVTRIGKDPGD